MCRALRVLCAAPDRERLTVLKYATVSSTWELVGGAIGLDQLESQIREWAPDVVVLDSDLGTEGVERARTARPNVRIVGIGSADGADGADGHADSIEEVRSAVLGVPPPGGPVRT
ncbi:MAG TPA: hypothetical protein VGH10_05755 [Actinomycetota bacterium]